MVEQLEDAPPPTPLGIVQLLDNLSAAVEAAEATASRCGAMDRERFERTMADSEGRPAVFHADDPRLLVGAPPLRDERERRQYAAFRSALSVKEHEEFRKLRNRAEARKRTILQDHSVGIGLYLAYCLDAVPDFESFFFRA